LLYFKIQLVLDLEIQSNLYIKGMRGNLQMCPLWTVVLYIQVTIICAMH